jgi:hypothetical protein
MDRWIKRNLDGVDLAVPLQLSDLILYIQTRSDGSNRRRGEAHRGLGFRRALSGEGGTGMVTGDDAVALGGDGVVDDVRKMMAVSKTCTAALFSSRCDGEQRPKTTAASGGVQEFDLLRF